MKGLSAQVLLHERTGEDFNKLPIIPTRSLNSWSRQPRPAATRPDQAQGITQVREALQQVDQITQQVAASAEESASAAEEMKSQAETLKEMVAHFKLSGDTASEETALKVLN